VALDGNANATVEILHTQQLLTFKTEEQKAAAAGAENLLTNKSPRTSQASVLAGSSHSIQQENVATTKSSGIAAVIAGKKPKPQPQAFSITTPNHADVYYTKAVTATEAQSATIDRHCIFIGETYDNVASIPKLHNLKTTEIVGLQCTQNGSATFRHSKTT
jgi:hypothetical protein